MWNDEDNNPYAYDSEPNPVLNPTRMPPRQSLLRSPTDHFLDYNEPSTPTSSHDADDPPEFLSRPDHLSDNDEDDEPPATQQSAQPRKQDGYDSRIQQLLFEDPSLEIIISDAAKDNGGGGFIVYTIRTGVSMDPRGQEAQH